MAAVNVRFSNPGTFSASGTAFSWLSDKPKDAFKFARDAGKLMGHCLEALDYNSAPVFSLAGTFNDASSAFNLPSFIKDL